MTQGAGRFRRLKTPNPARPASTSAWVPRLRHQIDGAVLVDRDTLDRVVRLCLGVSGAVPCVENRCWTYGRVTYVTLNLQGSCNNLCDTAPDPAEFAAQRCLHRVAARELPFRRGAPVGWLQGLPGRAARGGHRLPQAGRRLENFTRVETFGDNQANGTNDVNWLKVTVDPRRREVFSYEAQIVLANRVEAVEPPPLLGREPTAAKGRFRAPQ